MEVFQRHGVKDVFGIDGPWVDAAALEVKPDFFQHWDLEQHFALGRTFDLVSADTDRRLFTGIMPGTVGRSGQLAGGEQSSEATARSRVVDSASYSPFFSES